MSSANSSSHGSKPDGSLLSSVEAEATRSYTHLIVEGDVLGGVAAAPAGGTGRGGYLLGYAADVQPGQLEGHHWCYVRRLGMPGGGEYGHLPSYTLVPLGRPPVLEADILGLEAQLGSCLKVLQDGRLAPHQIQYARLAALKRRFWDFQDGQVLRW